MRRADVPEATGLYQRFALASHEWLKLPDDLIDDVYMWCE